MSSRTRIAVVYGGRSSEHSISCISAGAIRRALDPSRYEVVPIGITRDGGWYLQDSDPGELRIIDGVLPEVVPTDQPVTFPADPARIDDVIGDIDVVFPVLHGPYGEDGTVQGLFELAGVPYVGSGVLSSAVAMDKGYMKALFAAAGLAVGPYEVITDHQWRAHERECRARIAELGYPLFVKPARAGSSQGITKVHSSDELDTAIAEAREHDPRLVIEAGIDGVREIECAVMVDSEGIARASRCAEIIVRSGHEFYDFAAKYLEDAADLVVPADIPDDVESRIRELAVVAFDALGCEGLARVDFFLLPDGSVVVNEVNTMPGFTPISMFPRMWEVSGIGYERLVDALVADALRRGTGLR
jgi:D-alanine-D-alanine ligase